ncbi:MAG: TlpA disulfide reductase family protein [Myxococcota bacterium]|jgi:thiol-disulfide isomerase/thioredoxin|nr:TlpA disulfide reductase family protein [Myxococcota bacterium]
MPKPAFFSQTSLLFLLLLFLNCQPKNQNAKPTPADENQLIRVTAKDIHALVKNAEHEIVLVNVWATYCLPCIAEIPMLARLNQSKDAPPFTLLLVSADFPEEVQNARAFLREVGAPMPSYLKNEDDMPFINGLDPTWNGSLPVNILFYKGITQMVWEGIINEEELRELFNKL